MITYYQRTSETAGLTEQDKISSGSWVRSERPTASDIETLHEFGIDADLLTDALDPHEVPRIEHDDGWTYFITRVPDVGDNFNDYTTPMMFALGKSQTVTVSRDSLGRRLAAGGRSRMTSSSACSTLSSSGIPTPTQSPSP